MNAPNINIKDVLAKLSGLKNNLSLLVPILIAVVGLLSVIPTRLFSARLRSTVNNTSVAAGKEIDRLIKDMSPEKLKSVSPKYLDAVAQDANDFERLMDQTVKRELLSYGLFPDTNDLSRELFAQFGQRYREGVVTLVQGLKPGECPLWSEIQTALASVPQPTDAAGGDYMRLATGGANAAYPGTGLSLDTLTDTQRKIIDQLCLSKATGARVYAGLSDVAGFNYWNRWTFENRDKAYRDCWYWQLGYWIVEDVVATVQQMNGSTESVLTAPVKRLMNVGFTFQTATMPGVRPTTGMRTEGERPVYVTTPLKGLTTSCTGRLCNESADIVHFNVQVVVDATQVIPFMQALCSAKEHRFRGFDGKEPEQKYKHNQITILESAVKPVEAKDNTHVLYRYGDRQVVELDLICEYMLNRTAAYEGIKPAQAKADLSGQAVKK